MPATSKPLLPLFLDLDGRHALVLGAGEAAERRAATLRACGALVRHEADSFSPDMLDGCAIAVGAEAPDDALLAMTEAARKRGIPFNVVDRPSMSGFSTPAVVSRAPLQVAIASGGAAPVLARLLRARIETLVPPEFGRLATLADRMQAETRRRLPDVLRRRRMLETVFSGRVADLMLEGREAEAEAEYDAALAAAERAAERPQRGIVYLIESPPEADLLPLRALRLLGEADVIVHEALENPAVLELARRDASRRVVTASEAASVVAGLAKAGAKVVRLSPRPGEATALGTAGHDVVSVPGVPKGPQRIDGGPADVQARTMSRLDLSRTFLPVRIAVLTVSDSRTPATDTSGDILAARVQAAGHVLADRAIEPDDAERIAARLAGWIADPTVDVVVSTGGTGVTGRDVTPEAYDRVVEKRIEGFGELFRMLSYAKIGTSTIQSRAIAGVANGTYLFALPGSSGAVKDGWDDILVWQLDSRHAPCNFVELMPRLKEHQR